MAFPHCWQSREDCNTPLDCRKEMVHSLSLSTSFSRLSKVHPLTLSSLWYDPLYWEDCTRENIEASEADNWQAIIDGGGGGGSSSGGNSSSGCSSRRSSSSRWWCGHNGHRAVADLNTQNFSLFLRSFFEGACKMTVPLIIISCIYLYISISIWHMHYVLQQYGRDARKISCISPLTFQYRLMPSFSSSSSSSSSFLPLPPFFPLLPVYLCARVPALGEISLVTGLVDRMNSTAAPLIPAAPTLPT